MRFPFGTNDAPGYVERKGCAAKAIVNGNSLVLADPSARMAEDAQDKMRGIGQRSPDGWFS